MKTHALRISSKRLMVVLIFLLLASACAPNVQQFVERGKVEKLIKALGYKHQSDVRVDAARALGELGDRQALEPLIQTLQDEDPAVRCAAAMALGEIGDPGAVDALIDSSFDKNDLVRKMSIASLFAIGEPTIDALIVKLGSDSSDDRQTAVNFLSDFDTLAVPQLIKALTHEVERVQSGAHNVLLNIGPAAIPALIQSLSVENDKRNEEVMQVFIDFDTEAVLPLINALDSEDQRVSDLIIDSLVAIGTPSIEPLIDNLSDEDIHLQVQATLVKMGGAALPVILERVKSASSQDISYAADIFIEIGEPGIHYLIESFEADTPPTLIEDVVREVGSPAVLQLIDALNEENTRWQAAQILGLLKIEDSIHPLIGMLSDSEELVTEAAGDAIINIGLTAVDPLMAEYHDEESPAKGKAESLLIGIFNKNNAPVQEIAAKVCNGEAQEVASEYNRYSGEYHPMVIISINGKIDKNTNYLPVEWLPYTPEQLELVLCRGGSQLRTVQVCQYTYIGSGSMAPSIERGRYEETFTLYAASTGYQIGTTMLRGSNPDHCPMTTAASMTQITGGPVQIGDLRNWLNAFKIPLSGPKLGPL